MAEQIRFDDGAAYERMMGAWSRLAGEVFLDWIAPESGLKWLDVGCGNGAFSELIMAKTAPVSVDGVDPSEGQLAYARTRRGTEKARFRLGDAMALPFADGEFDAAMMALVIFFVPDPAKGVAEMRRVVRPGGTVGAYAWDIANGGFPMQPIQTELQLMGFAPVRPPQVDAARLDSLLALWNGAGLIDVATRAIEVERVFDDFDDFWACSTLGSTIGPTIRSLSPTDLDNLKKRVRARVRQDANGRVDSRSLANAIKGRVPQ